MNSAQIMVSGNLALTSQAAEPATYSAPVQRRLTVVNGAQSDRRIARDRQLWAPDVFAARSAKASVPVSRFRAVVAAFVLIALAGALAIGFTTARAAAEEAVISATSRIEISVAAGDSLWSIAAAHPVDGLDTARTVELIRSWNKLPSSMLTAGSILTVPSGR